MQRDDFNSVGSGITPPRGRQGHSVPTPKQLGMEIPLSSAVSKVPSSLSNQPFAPKLDSWPTTDLQQSGSSSGNSSSSTAISPAQFYTHRDHVFGGSLSKLDRLRSYPDSFIMEAFDETEENENSQGESFSKDSVNGPSSPTQTTDLPPPGVSRLSSSGGRGGAGTNMSLDKLTGDSLLFFSYSATTGGSGSGMTPDPQLGGSFVHAFTQGLSSSLSVPYFPCTSPVGGAPWSSGDQSHLFPTAARNPNKAIITIDAHSSRILMANEMTCELFGYQRNELSGMKIQNLFTEPYRGKQRALMEQNISASGETILVSGKVMDAMTSYGIEFPVSVWMRRVGKEKSAPPKSADSAAPSPLPSPTPGPAPAHP